MRFWYHVGSVFTTTSIDILSTLKMAMILWCGVFISYGSVPIDILLEHYLTGGRELYYSSLSTSNVIMTAVLSLLKVTGLLFVQHIEFLHDYFLDIFQSDNIWFLAPLSWMIVAYIVVYLRRRTSMFVPILPAPVQSATKSKKGRTNKHKFQYRHHEIEYPKKHEFFASEMEWEPLSKAKYSKLRAKVERLKRQNPSMNTWKDENIVKRCFSKQC